MPQWLLTRLTRLAVYFAACGVSDADAVARQVALLIEGANTLMLIHGNAACAASAGAAAEMLVARRKRRVTRTRNHALYARALSERPRHLVFRLPRFSTIRCPLACERSAGRRLSPSSCRGCWISVPLPPPVVPTEHSLAFSSRSLSFNNRTSRIPDRDPEMPRRGKAPRGSGVGPLRRRGCLAEPLTNLDRAAAAKSARGEGAISRCPGTGRQPEVRPVPIREDC